jgi:hypothetical protein
MQTDWYDLENHLDPARYVIKRLGGVRAVAEIAGVDESTVRRWMMPREKKGSGGFIPVERAQVLLQWARENKIKLKADDFFVSNATLSRPDSRVA